MMEILKKKNLCQKVQSLEPNIWHVALTNCYLSIFSNFVLFEYLCRTVYVTEHICHTCGTYSAELITAVVTCHIRFCNFVVNAEPYMSHILHNKQTTSSLSAEPTCHRCIIIINNNNNNNNITLSSSTTTTPTSKSS